MCVVILCAVTQILEHLQWLFAHKLDTLSYRFVGCLTILYQLSTAVSQWLRCCATNRKVAGSIPAGVSGFFFHIKSFRSHYSPRVDSASNRNEYQEHFLGVLLTTLPLSCADFMKSGNFNFLEPSGPLRTAVTQWFRCCATNRKVAGSIPAGVIGFFIDIKSFRSHYGPGVGHHCHPVAVVILHAYKI